MKGHSNGSILDRLEVEMERYTAAERRIANFILTNRALIAFETAASVAEKLDVSAVTVGRFSRRLGYRHFKELKAELKVDIAGVPWLIGDQLDSFVAAGPDAERLKSDLALNVAGLVEVYSLAQTPEWDAVATLLAHAGVIYVAGFQTERGVARHFCNLLHYVRPNVHEVDLAAGNYADVLADDTPGCCLVMIETRRYSKQAHLLAERARARGIELIIVTDKYCDWSRRFTPHVLTLATESKLFWNSMVPMMAALLLLANAVVGKLGARVEARLERFSSLYQDFTGHVGRKR